MPPRKTGRSRFAENAPHAGREHPDVSPSGRTARDGGSHRKALDVAMQSSTLPLRAKQALARVHDMAQSAREAKPDGDTLEARRDWLMEQRRKKAPAPRPKQRSGSQRLRSD